MWKIVIIKKEVCLCFYVFSGLSFVDRSHFLGWTAWQTHPPGYVTASHPETLGKTLSAQYLMWCNHVAEMWPQASHSVNEHLNIALCHTLAFENKMKRTLWKQWQMKSQMVLISQERCVIWLSVRSSGGDIQMGMMLHGGNMSRAYDVFFNNQKL